MDVWLVETGEYSQTSVCAVFATETLASAWAQEHHGYVYAVMTVWERTPELRTHHRIHGVVGEFTWGASGGRGWTLEPWGSEQREQWATDEVYSPNACTSRVEWWNGIKGVGGPISIMVDGHDSEAVNSEYAALLAAVIKGTRVPEDRSSSGE